MEKSRSKFGSTLGAVMALAGSAVGLGNIWKFPYVVGENGGGAFILLYIGFIMLIGFPVMLAEFSIGRKSQMNVVGAFQHLAPNTKWYLMGAFSIITSVVILSFYSTIAGWTLEYVFLSLKGDFANITASEAKSIYENFISNPYKTIFWQFIFMGMTAVIIIKGVKKGIEKFSKIMMPILFLILVAMAINALTLPGAKEGLSYLFVPKFDQLNSNSILAALGQSFFSLSIGMGILLTYASYLSKEESLVGVSLKVIGADTAVAILSGIAIIPAVFTFGLEPQAGPGLVFITLPQVFQAMPGGTVWAVAFFILLAFAALTSTISLLEVPVSYFKEKLGISRKSMTWLASFVILISGAFSTLSFSVLSDVKLFGFTIFDILDYLGSNIFLPLGGIFICIFSGWYLKSTVIIREITGDSNPSVIFIRIYTIILRYIAPIAILLVMLRTLGLF